MAAGLVALSEQTGDEEEVESGKGKEASSDHPAAFETLESGSNSTEEDGGTAVIDDVLEFVYEEKELAQSWFRRFVHRKGGPHEVTMTGACGQDILLRKPFWRQEYFALMLVVYPKPTDFTELLRHRRRKFAFLVIVLGVSMLMKYQARLRDGVAEMCGCTQGGHTRRTRLDRLLESFFVQFLTSIFAVSLQISLCTSYMVFWNTNHFVASYIPASSFKVFFVTLMILGVINEVDKCFGLAATHGTRRNLTVMWVVVAIWMGIFAVPMIGRVCCDIQYLWILDTCGWMDMAKPIFGAAYVDSAREMVVCCWVLLGIAVLEPSIFIALDLGAAHNSKNLTTPEATLAERNYEIIEEEPNSVGKVLSSAYESLSRASSQAMRRVSETLMPNRASRRELASSGSGSDGYTEAEN